jgi:hypothetical protein
VLQVKKKIQVIDDYKKITERCVLWI